MAEIDPRVDTFPGWCRVCGRRELVSAGKVAFHGDPYCVGSQDTPSAIEVRWQKWIDLLAAIHQQDTDRAGGRG